jgi:hypothetical protein
MNKPTIENRIAGMLSAADAKSDAIAALITEVEVAAQEADATAIKTREEALDPATVIDTAKVGASLATAELIRDRLRAALPRLQEQLKQAREREYVIAWREDYAAIKVRRDAVAQQLRERYPQLVEELVTFMTSIAAIDKDVDRINLAAPCGDYLRLRGVELTARGLDRLLQPDISITQELRLPNFTRGEGEPLLAYPPPQPTLAQLYVPPASYFVPVDPQAEAEERERRKREDNDKMKAFYENQQRVREEREAAEIERNRLAVP